MKKPISKNTFPKGSQEDRLFRKADRLMEKAAKEWSPYAEDLPIDAIICLGDIFHTKTGLLQEHLPQRFSISISQGKREATKALTLSRPEKTALLMNLDNLDWPDGAMDFLIDIRIKMPTLTVLLGSSDLTKDDFGRERTPICDASIRLPTTPTIFALALSSAWQNNHFHKKLDE